MATKVELQIDKVVRDNAEKERNISNDAYAVKLVEKVVWGLVGLILTGFILAIIKLVLSK